MLGEVPGHFQPDQEDRERQIITPEQGLLGALFRTQIPIHPRRRIELAEVTEQVLATITHRQRRVIMFRFALGGEQKKTLEELGGEFRVTRERIRQIEAQALRKLRHSSRSKYLKNYACLATDSVASSIAGLTDEGFSLVTADLAPLSGVPLSELAEASHLVEFVGRETSSYWKHTAELLNQDAKPFFEHLSDIDITTVKESITRVYKNAQAGFYKKPKEPESPSQSITPYPNRLFPRMLITLEDLTVIGPVPIEELGLSTHPYNALNRHWKGRFGRLPTIADLLSQTPEELLYGSATHVRNFGKGHLKELEQQLNNFLIERSLGEGKSAEEIIRELIRQLPEVPAGKYPLADDERITVNRYGSEITLTKSTINLNDGKKVSCLGLSLLGKTESKEQVIREFIQTLGEPSTRIASTKSEEIDFLSWADLRL